MGLEKMYGILSGIPKFWLQHYRAQKAWFWSAKMNMKER